MKQSIIVTGLAGLVAAFPIEGVAKSLHHFLSTRQYEAALDAMRVATDLNARSSSGRTPLTIAARNPANDGYDMVYALLSLGADPDLRDGEGATPLHYAARAGMLSVVHLLVDRFGAKVNAPQIKPDESETPIVWAALQGHVRVVRYLESRGAAFPKDREFDMRFRMTEAIYKQRLLGDVEETHDGSPFFRNLMSVRARVLALQDVGAPPLIIEHEQERLRAFTELAGDPARADERGVTLYREASRISGKAMSRKPGYFEQLKAWARKRRPSDE